MYYQRMYKSSISGNKRIPEYLLRKFINKPTLLKIDKLHIRAKRVYNEIIQEPLPLTFKLQEIPDSKNYHRNEPLGNTQALPFQVCFLLYEYI